MISAWHIFILLLIAGSVAAVVIKLPKTVTSNPVQSPREPASLAIRYCADCGAQINPRAEICPKCGVRQYGQTGKPGTDVPSRIMAALFAIFLGGLGVHKFYLGRPGVGILYILFVWTLIPIVIGFIEGLVYLSMTDEAFEQKYRR